MQIQRFAIDRSQILTWPNLITLVRLACIPLFVWLLFGREHRAAAAWLLAVLGSTDWVDGWLARRFDQATEFGAMFDPVVDRLLFFVAIPSLLIDGSVPIAIAVGVLAREALVAVFAVTISAVGADRLQVTWEGKTGTFLLMFAFPMFLGAASTLSYAPILRWLAWIFAVPGLGYSWYSAPGPVLADGAPSGNRSAVIDGARACSAAARRAVEALACGPCRRQKISSTRRTMSG